MNKIKEIMGQVFLSGAFLVRQFSDERKTLLAGISKNLPFEHKTKFAEDEIWVGTVMILEPQRYSLKGTPYEGWGLEDLITSQILLSELRKI